MSLVIVPEQVYLAQGCSTDRIIRLLRPVTRYQYLNNYY